RELDAPDERRGADVPRDADDEEIAEAAVEDELGGGAGVGAREQDGEGRLARGELLALGLGRERLDAPHLVDEALVARAEGGERVTGVLGTGGRVGLGHRDLLEVSGRPTARRPRGGASKRVRSSARWRRAPEQRGPGTQGNPRSPRWARSRRHPR